MRNIMVSHGGRQVNLREVCPNDVEAMAKRDTDHMLWEQCVAYHEDQGIMVGRPLL